MVENYVDRYLCPSGQVQHLNTFYFLEGEMKYISPHIVRSMDVYKKFKDIRNNPYNFIIGNGGLGKSTYLKQIKQTLEYEKIPCLLIELRTLSNEISLYEKLHDFCKQNKSKDIYLLLDAVDEAIDCNITNIAHKIKDALSQIIKINTKLRILNKDKLIEFRKSLTKRKDIKTFRAIRKNLKHEQKIRTIITCRDNKIPRELIPNLKQIYKVKEDNTFHLCRLTEDDIINIIKSLGCDNTEDFITKIKDYNLGCFASSPITLKPLVNLYLANKLNRNTNNYDIYEKLMKHWCDESEYRKNKALNHEDAFRLEPTDEILFVASKIAIELKLASKNEVSYNNNNNSIPVETFYGVSFNLPCGKKIYFSKDLVDYTLNTKIFCKIGDNFSIEQQTHKDFLVARYLFQMEAQEKDLYKLLKIGNDFHPSFTESLAYLAIKNNKIFKIVLKEIPERILLASVFFANELQKKSLFCAYLKCVKINTTSFWGYSAGRLFFNRKLYCPQMEKLLKNKIKNKDINIKEAVIDIIMDNRLTNFEEDFRHIIFNYSENTRIKVLTIHATFDCNYLDLLKEISKRLNEFNNEINRDKKDQLRGVLLNCLYPGFINDETMFKYIKEPEQDHYYGYYQNFLKYKLPKSVTPNNADFFMDWILKNRNLKEIVKNRYNHEYSETVKEIFKHITEYFNLELVDKYVSLQLGEEHSWHIASKDIINKILTNNEYRIYFIDKFIKRSSSIEKFRMFVYSIPNLITTYEIPKYLELYFNEKDEFRKNIIEILIQSKFRDYLVNCLTDDIDEIYNKLQTNEELKNRFGYFINAADIDSVTLEPTDKHFIFEKEHYYTDLKNSEEEKRQKQQLEELNNFTHQLENILSAQEKTEDPINTTFQLIKLLNTEKDTLIYHKNMTLVIDELIRWKDVPDFYKDDIINIFKVFLLDNPNYNDGKLEEDISNKVYRMIWNALVILPLINTDSEIYNKILNSWSDTIVYIETYSEESLQAKQNILSDLAKTAPESFYNSISKIILNSGESLPYNFLKSLDLCLDENLLQHIYNILISNENTLSNGIQQDIIQTLAYHQYKPIEIYIKDLINKLLKDKDVDNDKIGILLNSLLYGFKAKTWKYIKNLFFTNKVSKVAFKFLISNTGTQTSYSSNSMYKLLNYKELIKLYEWLLKEYPYINEDINETGIYNADYIKDFTTSIPDYFITDGNVAAYKKIKRSYLKNRKDVKTYKTYYMRGLNKAKYNMLEKCIIKHENLKKLEQKYYKEKKGGPIVNFGNHISGDHNINIINKDCGNKNINIGTGIVIIIIVAVVAFVLYLLGKIDFSQLIQLIK